MNVAFERRRRSPNTAALASAISATMNHLATSQLEQGKLLEAEKTCRDLIERNKSALVHCWHFPEYRSQLGLCLTKLGRFDEAENEILFAQDHLNRLVGGRDERTLSVTQGLIDLYAAWGKPGEAEKYRALLKSAKESGGNQ